MGLLLLVHVCGPFLLSGNGPPFPTSFFLLTTRQHKVKYTGDFCCFCLFAWRNRLDATTGSTGPFP